MAVLDLAFAWVLKCAVPGVHFLWGPGNPILLPAVVAFLHPLQPQWLQLLQWLLPQWPLPQWQHQWRLQRQRHLPQLTASAQFTKDAQI